eukprot:10022105-Karenia_brevis.AAC.1
MAKEVIINWAQAIANDGEEFFEERWGLNDSEGLHQAKKHRPDNESDESAVAGEDEPVAFANADLISYL